MTNEITDARAMSKSPHDHLRRLDSMSGEVSYWLECHSGEEWTRLEVYAHGPEWVCVKQEGIEGPPYWVRWDKIAPIRVMVS